MPREPCMHEQHAPQTQPPLAQCLDMQCTSHVEPLVSSSTSNKLLTMGGCSGSSSFTRASTTSRLESSGDSTPLIVSFSCNCRSSKSMGSGVIEFGMLQRGSSHCTTMH